MAEAIKQYIIPIFGITVTIFMSILITILTLLFNINAEVKGTSATVNLMLPTLNRINNTQQERSPSIHHHNGEGKAVYLYGGKHE